MADSGKITIRAAAKINLGLDVTGVLENGYHAIRSVFQNVSIYDEVEITDAYGKPITVSCETADPLAVTEDIPGGESNIAYKAASNFYSTAGASYGFYGHCDIHIKKAIPSQAGMGGGSADAAAVICGLRKMYSDQKFFGGTVSTDIPLEELNEAIVKTGADVPFFFTGGTAYVESIGEKVVPIDDWSGRDLVIAKGREGVSTAEAYAKIDSLKSPHHPDIDGLLKALHDCPDEAYRYFGNLFEDAVDLKEVRDIKSLMEKAGALNACMTGSGSAVFGVFTSQAEAEKCAEKLRESGFYARPCKTVKEPFIVIK